MSGIFFKVEKTHLKGYYGNYLKHIIKKNKIMKKLKHYLTLTLFSFVLLIASVVLLSLESIIHDLIF